MIAGASALLFAVMPVHVEAVTWISGATEPLMGTFFLAAFISYLKARCGTSTALWRVASLVLYTLAMLSKETALVMPAVIFFASWFLWSSEGNEANEGRSVTQRFVSSLRQSVPFIALTVGYLVARYFALHGLTHSLTPLPLSTLILTWPSILLFYVRLMIWPFGLSAFYETPYITSVSFSAVVLPLAILVLIAVGLFLHARNNRVVAFFTIWMVLPLLPLLNLSVFKDGELAHDRYLYLPSVGFCILVSMALQRINFGSQKVLGQPLVRVAALLALVAVFGIVTVRQTSIWASDFALASRGMELAPRNNMAANNYAKELALRGDFASAVPIFHQVIERRPNYWLPTFNLGFVYYQLGDLPHAEQYLRRAISIFPNDASEHRYLGFALLEMKRNAEAETELRSAIALQPNFPDQHFALGIILEEKGALAEALAAYQKEREINPKQPEVNAKIAALESMLHQLPSK